jgi:hypothetical protein
MRPSKSLSSKSPPKRGLTTGDNYEDTTETQKFTISSHGRFRRTISQKSNSDSNFNDDNSNIGCEKCSNVKEQCIKAAFHVRSYIDCVNEKINMIYHKTGSKRATGNVIDNDFSLPLDYYHTLYYSDLEKLKLGGPVLNQFRSLMKSVRLFNDKIEYIQKKCLNFEKLAHDYKKNYKLANKEDVKQLPVIPEIDLNDAKNLDVQNIFKNFNIARESFENNMKELRSSLVNNDKNFLVIYFIYNIM